MTTKIELEGDLCEWFLSRASVDTGASRVTVAILPDQPDILYKTPFGDLSFTFGSVKNGGGDYSPTIILDCSKIKLLQSSQKRNNWTINLKDSRGLQQLSEHVALIVSTEYDFNHNGDQYD